MGNGINKRYLVRHVEEGGRRTRLNALKSSMQSELIVLTATIRSSIDRWQVFETLPVAEISSSGSAKLLWEIR